MHPLCPLARLCRGVRPNVTTYNCLVAAASDAGSREVLQEVGRCLDGAELEIRASCLNAYVAGLAKARAPACFVFVCVVRL